MPSSSLAPILVLACLCLGVSACSTPETRKDEARGHMGPPQPPLTGKSAYFEGKIAATVDLNPAFRPRPAGGEDDGAGGNRERMRSRPPGGMGGGEGMHGEGRRRGGGEGMGGGGPHPGGGPHSGGGPAGMTPPRQTLTVTLTNTSSTTVNLQVTDVVSALGNFVPVPEKATLAPGESLTLEPMRGALANLEEFQVKLGLRADGKGEQQIVNLKAVPASQP